MRAKSFTFILVFALGCLGADAFAAKIFRKQTGTTTIGSAATSVNVTINTVTMSRSFMVFSMTVDANTPNAALVGGQIANSTTLTFTRETTGNTVTISWTVFEFVSGVTVQHGTSTNVGNPTNVTITSVNTAKAFVIATGRNDGSSLGNDDSFTANLTTSTNLQLTAPGSGVSAVYWQVVEYADANVQKVTGSIANGSTSSTTAITAVNVSKTMLISNHTISLDMTVPNLARTELSSSTQISYIRIGNSGVLNFVTYVVEFTDNTTVAQASQVFASTVTSQTVAVNASLTGSAAFSQGNQMRQGSTNFPTLGGNGDNVGHVWFTFEITKPLQLVIQRATGTTDGNSAAVAPWQLVTFENEVRTYYSLATGAWDSNTSWSLSSDGSSGALPAGEWPSRVDNVVIRTGHNITVDAVTDNYYAGVKPDDLGKANIGNSFESSNLSMFYHTGSILVTGTLTVAGGVKAMVGGYTKISGTFTTSSTLVNTGSLEAESGSTLTTLDDLILTGNSVTIINNTATSSDDLIIDHTDATLCGTGTSQLQNGAGSVITYENGATIAQVCTTFQITCTGVGCAGFPQAGTTSIVVGNTGPGGVGNNTGTSQLKLWFRSDNGLNLAGSLVNSWTNSAGISALNIAESGTERPTRVANAANGFAEVSFNGTNRLRTGLVLTTSNFVVDKASSFQVTRADNTSQQSIVYGTEPLDGNRFSNHVPWAMVVYYDIGTCCGTDARVEVPSLTGLTNYNIWTYTAEAATGKTLYRNGASLLNVAGVSTFNTHASKRFNMGGHITGAEGFAGDILEMAIYNVKLNDAERIIVDNYLSSKFDQTLSANDVYSFDGPGVNFDFDVAGIGRVSSSAYHNDSQGTGIVRMWNPSDLGNNEYLMWGHNGLTLDGTTNATTTSLSDVDGTVIKERLRRIWVADKTGDVGTVSVSFNISALTSSVALGSNLRLLIDRDNDGFQDNDVTPLAGSFSNNVVVFTGVNFNDGDRFTLGNTDSSFPLPIELVSFKAYQEDNSVTLEWKTASEVNNDYFTVLRSDDGEKWNGLFDVKGAGNSTLPRNYFATDAQPLPGLSYYRLKQTDFDGNATESNVVSVNFEEIPVLSAWPNPSAGTYSINRRRLLPEQIKVLNTLGQYIPFSIAEGDELQIDISNHPNGVYLLQVTDRFSTKTVRIVKKD